MSNSDVNSNAITKGVVETTICAVMSNNWNDNVTYELLEYVSEPGNEAFSIGVTDNGIEIWLTKPLNTESKIICAVNRAGEITGDAEQAIRYLAITASAWRDNCEKQSQSNCASSKDREVNE